MKWSWIIALIVSVLTTWFLSKYVSCENNTAYYADTVTVVSTDTITIVKHDTIPQVRRIRVVEYIPMSELSVANSTDTTTTKQDSLMVVQKEYTDDSTYTAYVSGIYLNGWPSLDSIKVKQQIIKERAKETVFVKEKQGRLKFGVQAGYGYGLNSKCFEPYIGVGIAYNF